MWVDIDDVVLSSMPLRHPDKNDVAYIQLHDSIAQHGNLEPICARPPVNGKYRILSGGNRREICASLGHKKILVIVHNVTDAEAVLFELIANANVIPVNPVDYARQMRRIMSDDPTMTVGKMAGTVFKTPEWVMQQLNLLHLPDPVQELILHGKIPLGNAYALSRVPGILIEENIEEAKYLPVKDFQQHVAGILREWRRLQTKGYYQPSLDFKPKASLRRIRILRDAIDNQDIASKIVVEVGCTTLEQAFNLGVAWAIQLDPVSVHQQRLTAERKLSESIKAAERRRAKRQKIVERNLRTFDSEL